MYTNLSSDKLIKNGLVHYHLAFQQLHEDIWMLSYNLYAMYDFSLQSMIFFNKENHNHKIPFLFLQKQWLIFAYMED